MVPTFVFVIIFKMLKNIDKKKKKNNKLLKFCVSVKLTFNNTNVYGVDVILRFNIFTSKILDGDARTFAVQHFVTCTRVEGVKWLYIVLVLASARTRWLVTMRGDRALSSVIRIDRHRLDDCRQIMRGGMTRSETGPMAMRLEAMRYCSRRVRGVRAGQLRFEDGRRRSLDDGGERNAAAARADSRSTSGTNDSLGGRHTFLPFSGQHRSGRQSTVDRHIRGNRSYRLGGGALHCRYLGRLDRRPEIITS